MSPSFSSPRTTIHPGNNARGNGSRPLDEGKRNVTWLMIPSLNETQRQGSYSLHPTDQGYPGSSCWISQLAGEGGQLSSFLPCIKWMGVLSTPSKQHNIYEGERSRPTVNYQPAKQRICMEPGTLHRVTRWPGNTRDGEPQQVGWLRRLLI